MKAAKKKARRSVRAEVKRSQRTAGPGGVREGAGRPARGEPGTPLQIRVTEEERACCVQAAEREGKALSEWAREALLLRATATDALTRLAEGNGLDVAQLKRVRVFFESIL